MHFDMQTHPYSGTSSFFLRHTFWQYRKENPQTRVGEPPPDGLPGFNSGVMLLDLGAMRSSALYNKLLEPSNVAKLADQYRFRGHLGDQDFFTMIGMEHPELFYSLACGWNRQLCTWWRDHGYGDIFQLYYRCDGPVYIYHGNCNTPIPDDWGLHWLDTTTVFILWQFPFVTAVRYLAPCWPRGPHPPTRCGVCGSCFSTGRHYEWKQLCITVVQSSVLTGGCFFGYYTHDIMM